MTGRDRNVLIGLIVLAVIAAGWIVVVSPERKKAESLNAKVSSAQSTLSTAQTALSAAKGAQSAYPTAYAAVVSLGKAVPAEQEVPSLIYELELASNRHNVAFNSITAGGASSGSGAAATPGAATGFTQMPFTFVFNGGFFSLEHLFRQLTKFTTHTSSGGLDVSGRLLTIQSVKLAPEAAGPAGTQGQALTGTIGATAYVLPPSQGVTAGATESSPTGAAAPAAASGAAPSSPTAPAIAKVTP
jgi:hypothetical protein